MPPGSWRSRDMPPGNRPSQEADASDATESAAPPASVGSPASGGPLCASAAVGARSTVPLKCPAASKDTPLPTSWYGAPEAVAPNRVIGSVSVSASVLSR